jgi:hypothetical protein
MSICFRRLMVVLSHMSGEDLMQPEWKTSWHHTWNSASQERESVPCSRLQRSRRSVQCYVVNQDCSNEPGSVICRETSSFS